MQKHTLLKCLLYMLCLIWGSCDFTNIMCWGRFGKFKYTFQLHTLEQRGLCRSFEIKLGWIYQVEFTYAWSKCTNQKKRVLMHLNPNWSWIIHGFIEFTNGVDVNIQHFLLTFYFVIFPMKATSKWHLLSWSLV